jgi:hypothetical protein
MIIFFHWITFERGVKRTPAAMTCNFIIEKLQSDLFCLCFSKMSDIPFEETGLKFVEQKMSFLQPSRTLVLDNLHFKLIPFFF